MEDPITVHLSDPFNFLARHPALLNVIHLEARHVFYLVEVGQLHLLVLLIRYSEDVQTGPRYRYG